MILVYLPVQRYTNDDIAGQVNPEGAEEGHNLTHHVSGIPLHGRCVYYVGGHQDEGHDQIGYCQMHQHGIYPGWGTQPLLDQHDEHLDVPNRGEYEKKAVNGRGRGGWKLLRVQYPHIQISLDFPKIIPLPHLNYLAYYFCLQYNVAERPQFHESSRNPHSLHQKHDTIVY